MEMDGKIWLRQDHITTYAYLERKNCLTTMFPEHLSSSLSEIIQISMSPELMALNFFLW
jgi:hypothetical protein